MIASVYADEFDCFDKWRRALVVSVLDAIKCRRRPWFLGKNASAVFPHLKHLVIGLGLSVELTCFHTSAMSSSCKHARLKLNLLVLSFVISLVAIARENQFLCTVFVTTHTPYYAIKMCWDFVCWFHQGQHCHHTLSNRRLKFWMYVMILRMAAYAFWRTICCLLFQHRCTEHHLKPLALQQLARFSNAYTGWRDGTDWRRLSCQRFSRNEVPGKKMHTNWACARLG